MPSEFGCTIEMDLSIPDFSDASIPLRQIAEKLKTETQENIRQQRSPDGTPFVPLSKKTISRKGFSTALIDKGIMYRAIHVYKLDNNTFEVGVMAVGKPRRDLVALIHQEQGVPSKKGRIARPFLGFRPQTLTWATARIERWIAEKMQKGIKKQTKTKY